jgi:hypothetical protein
LLGHVVGPEHGSAHVGAGDDKDCVPAVPWLADDLVREGLPLVRNRCSVQLLGCHESVDETGLADSAKKNDGLRTGFRDGGIPVGHDDSGIDAQDLAKVGGEVIGNALHPREVIGGNANFGGEG